MKQAIAILSQNNPNDESRQDSNEDSKGEQSDDHEEDEEEFHDPEISITNKNPKYPSSNKSNNHTTGSSNRMAQ